MENLAVGTGGRMRLMSRLRNQKIIDTKTKEILACAVDIEKSFNSLNDYQLINITAEQAKQFKSILNNIKTLATSLNKIIGKA